MDTSRKNAILEGLVHYEGRECPRCSTTLRYTCSSNCVQCTKTRAASKTAEIREIRKAKRGQG